MKTSEGELLSELSGANPYEPPPPKLPSRVDSCPSSPRYGRKNSNDFSCCAEADFDDSEFFRFEKYGASLLKETPAEPQPEGKKKRGKKRQEPRAGPPEEEKKQKRAEMNRRSAWESRQRKKQHVQDLEAEVKQLRQQLEYLKARLSKYELIDQQRCLFGYEPYTVVSRALKETYETNKGVVNDVSFKKAFGDSIEQLIEERIKALEQLARAMVEIVLPLPARFFLWIAENNMDISTPEQMSAATGNGIPVEHAKILMDFIGTTFPDKRDLNAAKVFLASVGRKTRALVKQLVACQRGIQAQSQRMVQFIRKTILPRYDLSKMQILSQLIMTLKFRPEFSDYGIYQLKDDDFNLNGSTKVGSSSDEDFEPKADPLTKTDSSTRKSS